MYKRIFYHSLLSGLLSGFCGWIYSRIHFFATQADFSGVLHPLCIAGYCLIISIIIGFIYWLVRSVLKKESTDCIQPCGGNYKFCCCNFSDFNDAAAFHPVSRIISWSRNTHDIFSAYCMAYLEPNLYCKGIQVDLIRKVQTFRIIYIDNARNKQTEVYC